MFNEMVEDQCINVWKCFHLNALPFVPRCSEFFQVCLDGPLGQVRGQVAGDPRQQVFGETREEALVLGSRHGHWPLVQPGSKGSNRHVNTCADIDFEGDVLRYILSLSLYLHT